MAIDLWQIRRRKRMTIEELARRAGIHPGLIKAYELGQRPIQGDDLDKLAQALEVERWDIKELSDPPPRGPSRQSTTPNYGNRSQHESGRGYSSYGTDYRRSSYGTGSGRSYNSDYRSPGYGSERPRGRYEDSGRSGASGARPSYQRDRRSAPRKKSSRRRQQPGPARPSQIEHLKMLLVRLNMSGDDFLRLAGKPLSMLNRKEAAQLLTTCQKMLTERKPPRPKGKRQRPYLPESVDEHELVYLTEVQLSKRDMQLTLFNGQTMEGKLLGFSPYALTLTKADGQEITVQKLAIAYYEVPQAEPVVEEIDEDVNE